MLGLRNGKSERRFTASAISIGKDARFLSEFSMGGAMHLGLHDTDIWHCRDTATSMARALKTHAAAMGIAMIAMTSVTAMAHYMDVYVLHRYGLPWLDWHFALFFFFSLSAAMDFHAILALPWVSGFRRHCHDIARRAHDGAMMVVP